MPPRKKKPEPELANLPPLAPLLSANAPEPLSVADMVASVTDERREKELEEFIDEVGAEGVVRIWHILDGKAVFAGEMSADGFSLDALLGGFGGGDKSLVFMQGRQKVSKTRVSLDPSIPPTNPRTKAAAAGTAPAQPAANAGTDLITNMLAMQMQSMNATTQMMTGMVTAMTSLMAARPEKDPMEMAIQLATLMKGNGGDLNSALSMLDKGLNLGKSLSAGGNDEDPTLGIVKEGIAAVGKIAEGIIDARRNPPPQQTPRAIGGGHADVRARESGGGGGVPVDSADAREGQGGAAGNGASAVNHSGGNAMGDGVDERLWIAAAREHAGSLAMAARFMDGDTAAVTLLRRMDDATLADFMDDMEDDTPPGFETRVRSAFPEFKPSPEWWEAFVGTMRANVDAEFVDGVGNDAPPEANAARVDGESAAP